MKKKYYAPTAEKLLLQIDDIIVASGLVDGGAGGAIEMPGVDDDFEIALTQENWK